MFKVSRLSNINVWFSARRTLCWGLLPISLGGFIPAVQADGRYSISVDGQEVTDVKTGLIWRRCVEGTNWNGISCSGSHLLFSAKDALERAASIATSTGVAWRLPNVKELASLVDRSTFDPAIDVTAFPATPLAQFWCSSLYAGDDRWAWYVDFTVGEVYFNYRYNINAVRLVRGGL